MGDDVMGDGGGWVVRLTFGEGKRKGNGERERKK